MIKRSGVIKVVIALGSIALITAFMGNACTKMAVTKSSDSSSFDYGACASQTKFIARAGAQTAATSYGPQVLENMVSCTGLGLLGLSQRTRDEFEARKASFSQYGYVGEVNSAMLMGVAAVAIEVCNDLANKERGLASVTDRRIFTDFNFAADASGAAVDNATLRMARSCWGRNPTAEESQIINDEVAALATTNAQFKAITLCTSVLASLDGIRQ